MQDRWFRIHVGDVLQDSSIHDTLEFKEKFSTFLPQIVSPWISWKIEIQGMDRNSLLLILKNIQAPFITLCDKCGSEYTHVTQLWEKSIKCFFDEWEFEEEEDILYFKLKEKIIDIEQYIVESFQLEDSVWHMCKNCEKANANEIHEN